MHFGRHVPTPDCYPGFFLTRIVFLYRPSDCVYIEFQWGDALWSETGDTSALRQDFAAVSIELYLVRRCWAKKYDDALTECGGDMEGKAITCNKDRAEINNGTKVLDRVMGPRVDGFWA